MGGMHWTELVGILLLMLIALPILAVLSVVVRIVWGLMLVARCPKQRPEIVETVLGPFSRGWGETWEGACDISGVDVCVSAEDVQGRPDPRFLEYVSTHRDELASLARRVRETLDCLSDQHIFDLLGPSYVGNDVCLGFSEEGETGETIFVEIKGKEIVTWNSAD